MRGGKSQLGWVEMPGLGTNLCRRWGVFQTAWPVNVRGDRVHVLQYRISGGVGGGFQSPRVNSIQDGVRFVPCWGERVRGRVSNGGSGEVPGARRGGNAVSAAQDPRQRDFGDVPRCELHFTPAPPAPGGTCCWRNGRAAATATEDPPSPPPGPHGGPCTLEISFGRAPSFAPLIKKRRKKESPPPHAGEGRAWWWLVPLPGAEARLRGQEAEEEAEAAAAEEANMAARRAGPGRRRA